MPPGVAAVVTTLNVDEPDPVTNAGVNDADAPAGRPVTVRLTALLNPAPPAMVVE